MTSLYYIILEFVKFSITVALRHTPKEWTHGKMKAKDYVIYVELSKLFLVILTVFLVPYIAPTLEGGTTEQPVATQEMKR